MVAVQTFEVSRRAWSGNRSADFVGVKTSGLDMHSRSSVQPGGNRSIVLRMV
jgi:hypothetical protein